MELDGLIKKGQRSKAEGLKVLLQIKAQLLGSKEENLIQRLQWLNKQLDRQDHLSWNQLRFISNKKFKGPVDRFINSLLLQIIAESKGQQMALIKLGEKLTLRLKTADGHDYFSIDTAGDKLSQDEVYSILHDFPEIKVLGFRDIFDTYLQILADELESKSKTPNSKLINIYDLLIAIRGFDSKLIIKKIELLNKLGEWRMALLDLRRYLSYNTIDSLPAPLKKLYFSSRNLTDTSH